MLKLIKLYYTILSFISPKTASNSAFTIFQKVRKKNIRDREKPFYKKAKHFTLPYEKENLDCYEFGTKNKDIVLLVHGWDSNAGCMLGFVEHLLAQNKKIISLNLPGHAFYKSNKTNYLECKQAFTILINSLTEYNSLSIISHSFGSGIVSYALSESNIKVNKLVFLTSPNSIYSIFKDFKTMIGLGDKAFELLTIKASKLLNEPVQNVCTDLKIKQANFDELLLIHDKNDKIIAYKESLSIHKAVKNSTLESFENIGHYRMLWNKDVIRKTIDFVT